MADDEKPKLLRFSDANPEMQRLDKSALDQAWVDEDQLEADWGEGMTPDTDRVPKGRAIAILALSGAIVIGAITFFAKPKAENPARTHRTKMVSSQLTDSEKRKLITENIEAFFTAATDEERLALVINPEQVEERLVRYYAERRDSGLGSPEIRRLRFVLLQSQPWAWATVTFPDRGTHVVALRETGDDYKIDWDCLVGYGDLSWHQLRETRPDEPVQMRALILLSDYYNYHYSDPKAYAVYALRGYETAPTIYGYVERDSKVHKMLQEVVTPGVYRAINLKLHYAPQSDRSDQVVIDKLLHTHWTNPKLITLEEDK